MFHSRESRQTCQAFAKPFTVCVYDDRDTRYMLLCCCWVAPVVSDSVWPHGGSPPGSPVPGILQARTLEWGAISFSNAWKWKVKVKLNIEAQSARIPASLLRGPGQSSAWEQDTEAPVSAPHWLWPCAKNSVCLRAWISRAEAGRCVA